jgi:HrpA-like RNA helicase
MNVKSEGVIQLDSFFDQIKHSMMVHSVVILDSESGSDKSTRLPRWLAEVFGKTDDHKIVLCVQPRRAGVKSLFSCARKIDGFEVGHYSVFYEKSCVMKGVTKYMYVTYGMFIEMWKHDKMLTQFSAIMLDECHEDGIDIHVALGIVKHCTQCNVTGVKFLLCGDNIDLPKFQDYFNNTGNGIGFICIPRVLSQSVARCVYLKQSSNDYLKDISRLIPEHHMKLDHQDSFLVVVPGIFEVNCLVNLIRDKFRSTNSTKVEDVMIVPFHSEQSEGEQSVVFERPAPGVRKIVIATNVAVASITIEDVTVVIDSGKAKKLVRDPITKEDVLQLMSISKSEAIQRRGRVGRTHNGIAVFIGTEEEYDALDEFPTPEIQRVGIESTVLKLLAILGTTEAMCNFDLIDPPCGQHVAFAEKNLVTIGAVVVDANSHPQQQALPIKGQIMARFPVDPYLANYIYMSEDVGPHSAIREITAIVAMMDMNPWINSTIGASGLFDNPHGDHICALEAYMQFEAVYDENCDRGQRWCRDNGLVHHKMKDVLKLRRALLQVGESMNFATRERPRMSNSQVADILKKILWQNCGHRIGNLLRGTYIATTATSDVSACDNKITSHITSHSFCHNQYMKQRHMGGYPKFVHFSSLSNVCNVRNEANSHWLTYVLVVEGGGM